MAQRDRKARDRASRARKASVAPPPLWRRVLWPAGLVLVTLFVYAGATENGLLNWDDNYYITESPYLKDLSWAGIKALFGAFLMGNYHPLTLLSYALEYRIAGRIDPALMHGTNVALHLLNTTLVYLLGHRLLGDRSAGGITAALFALHPMHVESVAWIAERKDVLYTAFFLLTMLAWLRYVRTQRPAAYAAAFLFTLLAMLSKSAAVVIAPVLLVLDHWERRPWSWRLVWEKIPFLVLGVVFGLVALRSQTTAMQADFAPHFPLWQRPLIAGYALFFYLTRFVAPVGLSAMHPYPLAPGDPITPLLLPAIGALAILGVLVFLAFRYPAHKRVIISGSLFFLLTLALVLQVLPVGRAIVAERYTYVPYIGLSLVVAAVVVRAWRERKHFVPVAIALCALAVFAGLTRARIPVWKDSITLFDDVLRRYPTDGLMYYNRGLTHYLAGRYQAAVGDFDRSVEHKPGCAECVYNRALAQKELGRMDAAVADLDRTLAINPDHAGALTNRGITKAMRHDYPGAFEDLGRALTVAPNDTNALINRGLARLLSDDREGACADWRRAATLGSRRATAFGSQHCPRE